MNSEESHGIKAKAIIRRSQKITILEAILSNPLANKWKPGKERKRSPKVLLSFRGKLGQNQGLPTLSIYNPWEARAGKNLGRGAVGYVERNPGRNHRGLTALVPSTTSNLELNQHLTTKSTEMDMDVLNSKLISELKNMDSDE